MLTTDFDYHLPENLIAQKPLSVRDYSRLMVLHKSKKTIQHLLFKDITRLLTPGDVLVLNNTKVIKARLYGKRKTGASIEIFLIEAVEKNIWKSLLKPAKRVAEGETLYIGDDFTCTVISKNTDYNIIEFTNKTNSSLENKIAQYGTIPLPPYIRDSRSQYANQYEKNYQTVFASVSGAVAAPTAGLHFTPTLLKEIKEKITAIEYITLHTGIGTFKPVQTEIVTDHKMHAEWYSISEETARRLSEYIKMKKRIIAIGTTVTRTLETSIKNNHLKACSGYSSLFIYPGYKFNVLQGLLTNFHLPKSTLLMLVSAFAGSNFIKQAYQEAIQNKYRFFSFGDAMLVLP
ncbi:MAG: tRNA preQ1(34) S-adenosylmethionine ribosyltransferase-isomerase QueA [bacterium]|nr:tRNA preQ1(34) S-adenosylmethionine ribosyltransferase-isomerase QueA [bacterium]